MPNRKPVRQGIELKKKHGQHFLKNMMYIHPMLDAVKLGHDVSIMEIGCGEGILTNAILQFPCKQLKVFEIDHEWATYVRDLYGSDSRLTIVENNVLDVDWSSLKSDAPWIMLANLPYNITFPILHKLKEAKEMFQEGVVMVQEEVAQKIVKTSGRGYGYPSLFFQYHFEWKLLTKIPPDAFFPPPKVFSRLLYFKPKKDVASIPQEQDFWKFIKLCFQQPRRTLHNNLKQASYDLTKLSDEILKKRAQQLSMQDFLGIWNILK